MMSYWDRFASEHLKLKTLQPIIRLRNWSQYTTPYWVGTQLLDRGLECEVSLTLNRCCQVQVELRIYIEELTAKADIVTLYF